MIVLRELAPADLTAVVALNDDAVPAVPVTGRDEMAQLVGLASLAVVAVEEAASDAPLAFLIAMDPDAAYGSENFRFFQARGTDFVYVDRIVVGAGRRGAGIGRLLYAAVFDRARRDGRVEVACEVNVRPANPGSLRFHAALGFEGLGEQETKGGAFRVSLLAAPVQGPHRP